MHIIDENDYYGCDFTNDRKMCMLFFVGASNYFPGIWVGDVDPYEVDIDTYPMYILDLQCADNTCAHKSCGNVKEYITLIIEPFIKSPYAKKKYVLQALQLQKDISMLSDHIIEKGTYVLRFAEDIDNV